MQSVLILGSTGMLGSTLRKYFLSVNYTVHTFNREDLDLAGCSLSELSERLSNKIRSSKAEYVINCAGAIKQRESSRPADMVQLNGVIPHWLSEISRNNKARLIHITTDCVFDGKLGNYCESETHTETDLYGRSKSIGEPSGCMVIRTSIIGEEEKNCLSLLEWVRSNKGKTINGFCNHIWNGVTCLQLGKIINQMIKQNIYWEGVRHIHSNSVNKSDLLEMINETYDLNITVSPMDAEEPCDRSLSSIHDVAVYEIPDLYNQIKELKKFHLSNNED